MVAENMPGQGASGVGRISRLQRFLQLARPYRLVLSASMAISTVSVAIALVLPLGLRELLDSAVYGGDVRSLNRFAALLLLLYLVRAALNFGGPLLLQLAGERISNGIKLTLYRHIHSLGLRYLSTQRTGDLLSRLGGDVAAVRAAITEIAPSAVLQCLKLSGSVAIMLLLNWRLSALIFAVAPIATLISKRFSPAVQDLSKQVQDKQADSMVVAQESLAGIRLVKAFNRSEYEVARFGRTLGRVYNGVRRMAIASTGLQVLVELVFMLAIVAIFWFGGREVLAGRLTAGDFIAFMFYAQNITQGISELVRLNTTVHRIVGASERVFHIFDVVPDVVDDPHAHSLERCEGRIAFDDVSFAYDGRGPVLRNISLRIEAGEHIAIVGLSGAGKSTLMHLLLRFFDPTDGRVLLDSYSLRDLRIDSVRKNISVVSQEVYLFGGSVMENIRYGNLAASDEEVEEAAKLARVHDEIVRLPNGYATYVGENGVLLSGGQRQRLALARAFLKRAPVLLLDEATSSVDVAAEVEIRAAATKLQADRTIIVITHRLESIRDADRIVVLHDGRIVADGSHRDIAAMPGLYASLLNASQQGVAV